MLAPRKKSYDQTRQHIKKQRHYFTHKGPYSQSYGFPSNHVWIWMLNHKEGWVPKNWCFLAVMLEKTLESPLDCKESKQVNPKRYQPWIFIGRTYVEAEVPIFWPPDVKNRFTGEDPDAGKDWGQEDKEVTEDKMVGWHHWCDGCEFSKLWEIVKDREGRTTPAIFTEWAALIHRALQKDYLVRKLSSWNLGSSISGATRRDRKVKERENKAPGMLQFLGL